MTCLSCGEQISDGASACPACSRPSRSTIPRPLERVVAALAIAMFSLVLFVAFSSSGSYRTDLDQVWHGSRAILHGRDPYAVVGLGLEFDYGFPLYYPLPALVALLPLAVLPLQMARLVFVSVSAALLAYAVTRDGPHRLWIFASGAFVASVATAQWAPLMTAAFLLPWLAPLVLAKPNIGFVLLAATPERKFYAAGLVGGGAILLLSFALDPHWVGHWLAVMRDAPHFTPPVLLWGGPLILLAVLRWRRPEARLLVALACVPHTTLAYEALPLLLVAKNWRQSMLLAALSLVVMVLQISFDDRLPTTFAYASRHVVFAEWTRTVGMLSVALLYLPATLLVLRRPNEGPVPAWLELWHRTRSALS